MGCLISRVLLLCGFLRSSFCSASCAPGYLFQHGQFIFFVIWVKLRGSAILGSIVIVDVAVSKREMLHSGAPKIHPLFKDGGR